MPSIISCIDHGVYGINPETCPLCPVCGQPMSVAEKITLQTIDCGPGHPDLLRLVHSDCVDLEDEDDE